MQKITGLSSEISDGISRRKNSQSFHISFYDSLCYCFNFLGILTGPYYTYKTYHDHLYLPFGSCGTIKWSTYTKYAKVIIISTLIFALSENLWSIDYVKQDEFYTDTTFIYRLFYIFPLFLQFRTKLYANNKFSEFILITAGLGVYPKILKSKCGNGPTEKITNEIIDNCQLMEMDYETVNSVNIYEFELCSSFRESVKDHWNKCVQFWLYQTVYSRLPTRRYRLLMTQLISSYWHGPNSGYFFTLLIIAIYNPLESFYSELLVFSDSRRKLAKSAVQLTMKTFVLNYMTVSFYLLDFDKFWRFYGSIHHIGYILFFVLTLGYIFLNKKH